jgi:cbb3-type cytochrome oxidase subunit 1
MTISIRFLMAAAMYGLISMVMGMVMGAKEEFTLTPVHAHLNLLGWIALTLYGIVYKIYPAMGQSKLATVQFYVANAGILVLIPSLAAFLLGNAGALPVLIVGELLTVAALAIFLVIIWNHRNQ